MSEQYRAGLVGYAVGQYLKVQRLEERRDKEEVKLGNLVTRLEPAEFEQYVKQTNDYERGRLQLLDPTLFSDEDVEPVIVDPDAISAEVGYADGGEPYTEEEMEAMGRLITEAAMADPGEQDEPVPHKPPTERQANGLGQYQINDSLKSNF